MVMAESVHSSAWANDRLRQSASWVPEKVREQHEDRLISVLVLASIWQQTIVKGLGPGNSSMAQDCPHRQNTTTHHEPRWVSGLPHRPVGRDWLHSSGLTIKDCGEMEEGRRWSEVEGMEREQQK
ncbi:unnamed protein product [Pleuronectes platessa]|uniref:Uncharacterized protein n=1 Tax=Pleuronectes platessa TaxID=8262 RepID=A0A9N7UXU4_PLEPL|nr:unnamed protein product [Pleuronectes platessa]